MRTLPERGSAGLAPDGRSVVVAAGVDAEAAARAMDRASALFDGQHRHVLVDIAAGPGSTQRREFVDHVCGTADRLDAVAITLGLGSAASGQARLVSAVVRRASCPVILVVH